MAKKQTKREDGGDSEPEGDSSSDGLVRLNKFMAELGVASRRKCDEMIAAGKVSIDGEPAVELGTKIDPLRQVVDVNGVVLKPLDVRRRYYLLNKPRHVLCTNESREVRARAIDLITDRNKGRIFSVGRLDEDSSGLLILTNDGDFTNQIAHPRHIVPKTYLVKVRGRIDDQALERISAGVRLSEGKTGAAALHVERRSTEASVLTVTIREGMNREIRRVFAALGYKVLRLHRVRIGALADRRLKVGEWRPLTPEEVADLLDIAKNKARAEELFQRASHGSYAHEASEADESRGSGERPSPRKGERTDRLARGGEREEKRSRFGGQRREWHEPKEFRIKTGTRKPREGSVPTAGASEREGADSGRRMGAGAVRRGSRTSDTGTSSARRGSARAKPEGASGGRGAGRSRPERSSGGRAKPGRAGGGNARPDRGGSSRARPERRGGKR